MILDTFTSTIPTCMPFVPPPPPFLSQLPISNVSSETLSSIYHPLSFHRLYDSSSPPARSLSNPPHRFLQLLPSPSELNKVSCALSVFRVSIPKSMQLDLWQIKGVLQGGSACTSIKRTFCPCIWKYFYGPIVFSGFIWVFDSSFLVQHQDHHPE